jgi:CBS domain-containing protein
VSIIKLSDRQNKILQIVKECQPITGEGIADMLNVTRAALRPDLAVLTISGFLEAKPRVGYTFNNDRAENEMRKVVDGYKVQDIQSLPAIIRADCSVYDAIVTLFMEDSGSLFVVDSNNWLCGLVSRKDLLKATIGEADIHKIPVSVIMTRMPNIVTVTTENSVMEAVQKIVEHEVDCLPVIKMMPEPENNEYSYEVVGKISKTNITRLFLDLASM